MRRWSPSGFLVVELASDLDFPFFAELLVVALEFSAPTVSAAFVLDLPPSLRLSTHFPQNAALSSEPVTADAAASAAASAVASAVALPVAAVSSAVASAAETVELATISEPVALPIPEPVALPLFPIDAALA